MASLTLISGAAIRSDEFSGNVRMAKADEVTEWIDIGNDDHARGYRLFAVNARSSVAMSLSRSSTVKW
jgi:hypothetical protein